MQDLDIDDKKKSSPGAHVTEKGVDVEDHKRHAKASDVDAAAELVADFEGELDPAEAQRVLRKIDWHLLPPMMILYFVQFSDKTTLGAAANLGLKTDTNLSTSQYNWLGTIFYLSYLIFELPQSFALQRFHVGKWMAINVCVWGVALYAHAACKNFGGLFGCRLVLGVCEGSITAGFMILSQAFYRPTEAARRVGFWFLMNGTAQIISGLLALAVLQSTASLAPWRIFFLIFGSLTMIVGVWFFLAVPSSPANAWFLTPRERAVAVERLIVNNESYASQGSKQFKREQLIECLLDWKTLAFFVFAALDNVPNSLTNQSSLIIKSLGYTTWQTSLLGCVSGVIEIITIYTGTLAIKKWNNSRAVIGAIYFIPNILGSALIIGLPFSNKAGQLISLYITGVGTTGFVLCLSWASSVTGGSTKAKCTNAILLIGYCLGNLCAPQMWKAEYAPRNQVPWLVILICYTICPLLMLAIAWGLRRENRRRDALPNRGHGDGFGFIDEVQGDGTVVSKKVPIQFLDLTDRQDLSFRYVL